MNTRTHYDVAIIGAGMAGLAAGIRLAHFGKSVCIFERHNAVGGLNSFYSIAGRKFDVGLHALTNFVRPGVKGTPLTKLLRQLRLDRDALDLCEQKRSRVAFGPGGETSLTFTNDFVVFESEVARVFPHEIDGFRALLAVIRTYDDVGLDARPVSARAILRQHLRDPLLEDMLLCPVMYYGSAQERDMEFGQFVIMFKALFLEGFARPLDGVRVILRQLVEKYREAGGERRMKCGVQRLVVRSDRAAALVLDDGAEITADHVLSSIGGPETWALFEGHPEEEIRRPPDGVRGPGPGHQGVTPPAAAAPSASPFGSRSADFGGAAAPPPGRLSFVETISILDRAPEALGWGDDTIVFFNDSPRFDYACPAEDAVDPRSGVICFPNNFAYGPGRSLPEGVFRVTCLADYERWRHLPEADYRAAKARWFARVQQSARRFLPPLLASPSPVIGPGGTGQGSAPGDALAAATVTTDMFTPCTVERFTGHRRGAIYGSPAKLRDGRTPLKNLYLCGTDQGFLGIIGALLSGISMANLHILQPSTTARADG